MTIKENLRALLDLMDDLQNGQLELRSKIAEEHFNNLIRQAHNPQSGVLGEPMDDLLKRVLQVRFQQAIVEVDGRERRESLELVRTLIDNVDNQFKRHQIDVLALVPMGNVAGEAVRLLSMVLTSMFGNNRRRIEQLSVSIQKATKGVQSEMEGVFSLFDNLQLMDRVYTQELNSIEMQLTQLESALFLVVESVVALFQKIVPDFALVEKVSPDKRINEIVLFAETEILTREEHLAQLEGELSNILFFININLAGAKSKLLSIWQRYLLQKTTFHETFIGEIQEFQPPDDIRKEMFLADLLPRSQEVLENLALQVENLSEDLSRKAAILRF